MRKTDHFFRKFSVYSFLSPSSHPRKYSPLIPLGILLAFFLVFFFSSTTYAAQLTLAWDSNSDPDVAGYRVYYGTASRTYGSSIDVGKVTNYTATGLTQGQVYFFAVTAHDSSNNESGYSNEASGTAVANLPGPGVLVVTPSTGMSSSARQGGPFSPASQTCTLQNTGGSSLTWTTSKGKSWVTLSASSGSLAAGATTNVTVSINSNGNTLSAGSYSDSVTFRNTTNGNGITCRSISLSVLAAVVPSNGKKGIIDFDGDGKTDPNFWDPTDGNWHIVRSSDGRRVTTQWGARAYNDVPVPGDYDGDGRTDMAIWRPADKTWYIIHSSDGGVLPTLGIRPLR